jgi:hypothetical protein
MTSDWRASMTRLRANGGPSFSLHRDCHSLLSQAAALAQLASVLRELSAKAEMESDGLQHGALPKWQDGHYLYVETDITDQAMDMDLCIHNGRAFFRLNV